MDEPDEAEPQMLGFCFWVGFVHGYESICADFDLWYSFCVWKQSLVVGVLKRVQLMSLMSSVQCAVLWIGNVCALDSVLENQGTV